MPRSSAKRAASRDRRGKSAHVASLPNTRTLERKALARRALPPLASVSRSRGAFPDWKLKPPAYYALWPRLRPTGTAHHPPTANKQAGVHRSYK